MIVTIIKKKETTSITLPSKIYGDYWIHDSQKKSLVNIQEENGTWIIKSTHISSIKKDNSFVEKVRLLEYHFYVLNLKSTNEQFLIYCSPVFDDSFIKIAPLTKKIIIGSDNNCDIQYENSYVMNQHIQLEFDNNLWKVTNLNNSQYIFLNHLEITEKQLKNSDMIFLMGLKIIVLNDFLIINNPNNKVKIKSESINIKLKEILQKPSLNDIETDIPFYTSDDFFHKSPRFRTLVENKKISIDPPPPKQSDEEIPIFYTLGPMLTMGMTSSITGITAILNVNNGTQSFSSAIPSIFVSLSMMATMILWPILTKKYEKSKKKKKEKIRQEKYKEYILTKQNEITSTIKVQQQILLENSVSLKECEQIILTRKRQLWEREIDQKDFMNVRLGIGSLPPQITIDYPEQHFSLDEDNLQQYINEIKNQTKRIDDTPISISLVEKNISAIIGQSEMTNKFIQGILLQLMTFHSYQDLKIVVFTDDEKSNHWESLKFLPHCWDNEKSIRFFCTKVEEMKQVSSYLLNIFNDRKYVDNDLDKTRNLDYKFFPCYYLIFIDNIKSAQNIEIIQKVLNQNINMGFSILICNDRLSNLPKECSTFITLAETGSGIFENELIANKQKEFTPDIDTTIDIQQCVKKLANIPIDLSQNGNLLPSSISFLQTYNVGKVEQLNVLERWQNNDPTINLKVPVGKDEANELFYLDLHEKFHGPHGLIAGMTGSGKSEFIITYILSLAINYHPHEVSFILIDYKGGGLAGAFNNKETGVKLPHLAGTITNLDTIEMKRSLASIQSELKRRQRMFNQARDQLNESTIDIYKYQKLYREKRVELPIPHLFIICDEFAELKDQQPEFLSQLISTARIGRSLGVHLILATQKPAGVVDNQIWSNSKFRVCLKVQDKADSMDMIKCPDAAMLKQTGRFYLQVGYNELFRLGQSAWSGAPYFPTEEIKPKIDSSIEFVDNIGYSYKSIEQQKKNYIESKGEELKNVLNYIVDLAKKENVETKQLWLDRIPDEIFVEELKKKYQTIHHKLELNPIIGEFDDPNNQKQDLLTIPISKEGNAIIYGSSGSGKELLLTTMIYSLIMQHSSEELNTYILDFGSETLQNFSTAPQIGDVLSINDEEKINNLFKFLLAVIDERKKLFANYNGNFKYYYENSSNTIPNIVVVINNYEAFSEIYDSYNELLLKLSRDSQKYGIYFILTVINPNSIRYRLQQNFKLQYVLQMNNPDNYVSILGNTEKLVPSKSYGRGLVKIDHVYEFQTALAYELDSLTDYIKAICERLQTLYQKKAISIPTLPEKVTIRDMKNKISNIKEIPIGIIKNNLEIQTYNFIEKPSAIYSNNMDDIYKFLKPLIKILATIKNQKTIIIDSNGEFKIDLSKQTYYYKNNFEENINQIINFCNQVDNYNIKNKDNKISIVIIIIGIDKIKKELQNSTILSDFFNKISNLEYINNILVDTIDNIKKVEYEAWYSLANDNSNGIWIGNGIADQFTLKLGKTPKEIRDEIGSHFGYSVIKQNPTLIKLIEEDGESNE